MKLDHRAEGSMLERDDGDMTRFNAKLDRQGLQSPLSTAKLQHGVWHDRDKPGVRNQLRPQMHRQRRHSLLRQLQALPLERLGD